MPVTITIRSVSDEVRDVLAARAAKEGRSLQEYLLRELIDLASRPVPEDFIDDVQRRASARSHAKLTTEQILADRDADRK